jgi:hypothetical protein
MRHAVTKRAWVSVAASIGALALAALTACSSNNSARGHQSPGTTVLGSTAQQPTFTDVTQAIDGLYQHHPAIESFAARDVQYNATTRDKVLETCHQGGAETDTAALESTRIAGCAPLIFFFYSYGRQASVPEATAAANTLYWYARTNIHGPFDPKQALDTLLKNWGVQ